MRCRHHGTNARPNHCARAAARLTVSYAILAPLIRGQKGEHRDLFEDLRKQGFGRARVNGKIVSLSEPPSLERQMRHTIEAVVDRIDLGKVGRQRLSEAVDTAIRLGKGTLMAYPLIEGEEGPRSLRANRRARKRSFSLPTMFVRNAAFRFRPRALNCSASIARKACVPPAMASANDIPFTQTCSSLTRRSRSTKVRFFFLEDGRR